MMMNVDTDSIDGYSGKQLKPELNQMNPVNCHDDSNINIVVYITIGVYRSPLSSFTQKSVIQHT